MKAWIDLSNSPHPLLFAPVVRALEARGHAVVVTARDNAQTVGLARERWPDVKVIGGQTPSGRAAKAGLLMRRAGELWRWARHDRPDVALSHNSYAQIVAARAARIPAVTAMDFEHQPANHVAFRLARTILVPEAFPESALRAKGARPGKVRRYPGLKEELYLGEFEPDPHVLEKLGIERESGNVVVIVRSPPSRALYHRFGNPLFEQLIEQLGRRDNARVVALVRHSDQAHAIEALGLTNVVVPQAAVDSRSLIYAADLVIGAGGTMTREAALMGVPTLSAYAGTPPAVDRLLEAQGRLRRITSPEELGTLQARDRGPEVLERLRGRSAAILETFVNACEEAMAGLRDAT